MKINRNPIVTLPDDVFKRDHAFWSKNTERFIGNWITYDTSVQQIADWVEKFISAAITPDSRATGNSSATTMRKRRFPNCAVRRPGCMPGGCICCCPARPIRR